MSNLHKEINHIFPMPGIDDFKRAVLVDFFCQMHSGEISARIPLKKTHPIVMEHLPSNPRLKLFQLMTDLPGAAFRLSILVLVSSDKSHWRFVTDKACILRISLMRKWINKSGGKPYFIHHPLFGLCRLTAV